MGKKVLVESNLSEVEENDISEVLARFISLNPGKHISQSLPMIDNILSSFEIEKYQIEFKNMSCGPKVVIEKYQIGGGGLGPEKDLNSVERLISIYDTLNKKQMNGNELSEKYEVSRRTIDRDIKK